MTVPEIEPDWFIKSRARLTLFCYVTIWEIHSHENTVQRDLYFKARKLCSDTTQQKLNMGSALSSYKSKRRDKKEYKRWVNIFPLGGKYSDALATRFFFYGHWSHRLSCSNLYTFLPSSRKLREQLKEAQEHVARLQEQLQCANE